MAERKAINITRLPKATKLALFDAMKKDASGRAKLRAIQEAGRVFGRFAPEFYLTKQEFERWSK